MTIIAFAIILQFGSFLGHSPSAQTVWVKGTVTKAAWSDRHLPNRNKRDNVYIHAGNRHLFSG